MKTVKFAFVLFVVGTVILLMGILKDSYADPVPVIPTSYSPTVITVTNSNATESYTVYAMEVNSITFTDNSTMNISGLLCWTIDASKFFLLSNTQNQDGSYTSLGYWGPWTNLETVPRATGWISHAD